MLAGVASSAAVLDVYFRLVGSTEDRSGIIGPTPNRCRMSLAAPMGTRRSRRFALLPTALLLEQQADEQYVLTPTPPPTASPTTAN
jgi:hypothetical protein